MGWKDWSYWLKGGVIGICIGIILSVLIWTEIYSTDWLWDIMVSPNFSLAGWITGLFSCNLRGLGCFGLDAIISNALTIFEFIIVGALIGWIYGKIKNRK